MFERSDLFPNHVVTNWTWVCPLAEQQSQFIDTGLWWRKVLCLVQGSAKRTGSSWVKDPNSPMAFRELFFFLMCLLIHRLCWVFVAVHGLSLVAASWSRSLVVLGLLIAMASLVAGHRLRSVVVAHGLSCPVAHRIFPDQGLNLCPLHWKVDSQSLDH